VCFVLSRMVALRFVGTWAFSSGASYLGSRRAGDIGG
jgi:hypothetical protein